MTNLRTLRQWLEAEEALGVQDAERSEATLTSLFGVLPLVDPSSDLVDAVLVRLGQPESACAPAWMVWLSRTVVAAALVLVSTSLLWLPLFFVLFPLPTFPDFVRFGAAAVETATVWLEVAISLWSFLVRVGDMAALVFASPPAVAGVALTLGLGLVAFRCLVVLSRIERSSRHAAS